MQVGLLYSSLRGFNAVDGGIASHFSELAAGLVSAGAKVRVYVVSDHTPPSIGRTADGYEVVSLSTAMPKWIHRLASRPWQLHFLTGLWLRSRAAARLVLEDHAARPLNVIETSSSGLLGLHLSRSRHRPPLVTRVSTTCEQLVTHNFGAASWLTSIENALERSLVTRSDAILTHTRHHRDAFCAAWGLTADHVKIIPHGIALPPAGSLRPLPTPDAPLTLLYVGRFEHRKGIDTLLSALPAVLARHPRARAVLAGQDPGDYWQSKFWSEQPALDRSRVQFAGRVNADTLATLYQAADIFVGPSRYESFGLIYVEAMSWAKPVVACAAGGIPEVVVDGETGLLLPPGDTALLVRHLDTLLASPALRARLGGAGRDRAVRLFSREVMSAASLSLYTAFAR